MNSIFQNNTNSFIPLLTATILTDIIIIFMNYYDIIFVSKQLNLWYQKFRLSAMIMDCAIIFLYAIGGAYLVNKLKANKTLLNLMIATVFVQVVGDLLFYAFYTALPRGTVVFDFFKDYTKEIGAHALWADAVMMCLTLLFFVLFSKLSKKSQAISLITIIYISQYILYLKEQ